ncbi:MAG: MlaD family protein [Deltaproteobacteria bacterium]|jgi:phospholipid/cholesterol/gamma-HCH transport system substrate-binding protein|nr:MlaD family protein [Deltaproteobacteria bacterium]
MSADTGKLIMARAPYTFLEKLTGFLLVALFLVVMGAAAIVGAGRGLFRGHTSYFAVFSQGYGIAAGVDVRYFGIDIGTVTSVELMDNNKIRMRLRIVDDYADRILGDCLAVVKSPTIIGSEFIEIQPGSLMSLPVPAGGQIPAQDTATLEDMLAALELPKKIVQADRLMQDFISIADRLQDAEGPLFATLENFRVVSSRVAEGEGSLGALLSKPDTHDEIFAALEEAHRAMESIRDASASFRDAMASVRVAAAALESDIPGITRQADRILAEIEQGTQSFPEVARGAREGIRDVHQVLDSAKRNFLIRGNITADPPPQGVDRPLRGR